MATYQQIKTRVCLIILSLLSVHLMISQVMPRSLFKGSQAPTEDMSVYVVYYTVTVAHVVLINIQHGFRGWNETWIFSSGEEAGGFLHSIFDASHTPSPSSPHILGQTCPAYTQTDMSGTGAGSLLTRNTHIQTQAHAQTSSTASTFVVLPSPAVRHVGYRHIVLRNINSPSDDAESPLT